MAFLFALVLILPFPGSLSVVATRGAIEIGRGIPALELAADGLLLVLALATASAAGWAWVRRPERRASVAAPVIGTGLAYASSEGLKALFGQSRPCSRWVTGAECPPSDDWSLPSNHATLAFAAVVVIVIAVRSTWVAGAVVVALAVSAARVLQGVHYLHDVAAGALLGLAVPAALAGVVYAWRRRPRRE